MQVATQDAPVNGPERLTDWNAVNWRQAERRVNNLRRRIFAASARGDLRTAASLQKLMLRSYANTLVSVRRVTQVNQGKYTPGVDKVVIKTPAARGRLVDVLMQTTQPWKARPARRVYIPKANGKLRPLGIPTIFDRVMQARVKNALEPFWEARFEGTSYGFRPGRSCHDALGRIYTIATPHKRKKWVVDADIKGAFDNISHDYVMQAIGPVPGRELIRQWLKAGYVEMGKIHATDTGTPQGGVISPLLANIALHGMEEALTLVMRVNKNPVSMRVLVRYADDFVVFCESKDDAEQVFDILTTWLAARGLAFSEEKTRIVHLAEGFDFLGFTIKHYQDHRTKTGYRLLITPSSKSVADHIHEMKQMWRELQHKPVAKVCETMNRKIRGWTNYFRIGVASKTFHKLTNWESQRAYRFARYRHPKKSWTWICRRYYGQLHPARKDRWVFGDKDTGIFLLKYSWTRIERHVMVKGTASPDDPTLRAYWDVRREKLLKRLSPRWWRLALSQKGLCPVCGQALLNGEDNEQHHIVPRVVGGGDQPRNLRLVHMYCHDQIHSGKAPSRAVRELLQQNDAL